MENIKDRENAIKFADWCARYYNWSRENGGIWRNKVTPLQAHTTSELIDIYQRSVDLFNNANNITDKSGVVEFKFPKDTTQVAKTTIPTVISHSFVIPEKPKENTVTELKPIASISNIIQNNTDELRRMMNDYYKKVIAEWDNILKDYLKKNLAELGYNFRDEQEFLHFAASRINRVGYHERPHYWEFYIVHEGRDRFIGSCSDKVDTNWNGGTYTVTIGE